MVFSNRKIDKIYNIDVYKFFERKRKKNLFIRHSAYSAVAEDIYTKFMICFYKKWS